MVTLEEGLDPDRFIRERGVEAYTQAVMGARRQSDYLIERARQMFPGAAAEQKVKAMNYLLPHIRRIPEKLARDQFAMDAAQKLGIDSAVLREELRQAALRRRDHIEVRTTALTEVERVLLRALAITDPEHEESRRAAADAVSRQPEWFEGLGVFPALQALAERGGATRWTWSKIRPRERCWRRPARRKPSLRGATVCMGAITSLQQRKIESGIAGHAGADPGGGAAGGFCGVGGADAAESWNWTGPCGSCRGPGWGRKLTAKALISLSHFNGKFTSK